MSAKTFCEENTVKTSLRDRKAKLAVKKLIDGYDTKSIFLEQISELNLKSSVGVSNGNVDRGRTPDRDGGIDKASNGQSDE